jgi:hypothetical protein
MNDSGYRGGYNPLFLARPHRKVKDRMMCGYDKSPLSSRDDGQPRGSCPARFPLPAPPLKQCRLAETLLDLGFELAQLVMHALGLARPRLWKAAQQLLGGGLNCRTRRTITFATAKDRPAKSAVAVLHVERVAVAAVFSLAQIDRDI